MYRQISKYTDQNSEKALLGGGGGNCPPPPLPPLATLMTSSLYSRKCWHFYILKLLFLSIFCRYIIILCRYKWHACRLKCTDKFPNVPTKIRKGIIGGGGAIPSGYANDFESLLCWLFKMRFVIWYIFLSFHPGAFISSTWKMLAPSLLSRMNYIVQTRGPDRSRYVRSSRGYTT